MTDNPGGDGGKPGKGRQESSVLRTPDPVFALNTDLETQYQEFSERSKFSTDNRSFAEAIRNTEADNKHMKNPIAKLRAAADALPDTTIRTEQELADREAFVALAQKATPTALAKFSMLDEGSSAPTFSNPRSTSVGSSFAIRSKSAGQGLQSPLLSFDIPVQSIEMGEGAGVEGQEESEESEDKVLWVNTMDLIQAVAKSKNRSLSEIAKEARMGLATFRPEEEDRSILDTVLDGGEATIDALEIAIKFLIIDLANVWEGSTSYVCGLIDNHLKEFEQKEKAIEAEMTEVKAEEVEGGNIEGEGGESTVPMEIDDPLPSGSGAGDDDIGHVSPSEAASDDLYELPRLGRSGVRPRDTLDHPDTPSSAARKARRHLTPEETRTLNPFATLELPAGGPSFVDRLRDAAAAAGSTPAPSTAVQSTEPPAVPNPIIRAIRAKVEEVAYPTPKHVRLEYYKKGLSEDLCQLSFLLKCSETDLRDISILGTEESATLRAEIRDQFLIWSHSEDSGKRMANWTKGDVRCHGQHNVRQCKGQYRDGAWLEARRVEACSTCYQKHIPCFILDAGHDQLIVLPLRADDRVGISADQLNYWSYKRT